MASSKKKALPEGGAAFAVPLADGRYGVCRCCDKLMGMTSDLWEDRRSRRLLRMAG